jgi:hypothetical protein
MRTRRIALLIVASVFVISIDTYAQVKASSGNSFQNEPFYQFDERWAKAIYDKTQVTIQAVGCAMVCASNFIRSLGITKGPKGEVVNPLTLNSYLTGQSDGYIPEGLVNWYAVAHYIRECGYMLFYKGAWARDDQILDNELRQNRFVILEVRNVRGGTHFVVATAIIMKGKKKTYQIVDPGNSTYKTLLEGYNNAYKSMRLFSLVSSPTPNPGALIITVNAPIELCVIDPQNRRTGKNPANDKSVNQIPVSSSYFSVGIGDDFLEDGDDNSIPTFNVFESLAAIEGEHNIQLSSPSSGEFRLEIIGYGKNGEPDVRSIKGTISPDIIVNFKVQYSKKASNSIQDIVQQNIAYRDFVFSANDGEELTNDISSVTRSYKLTQNYPNPFNPSTMIDFSLPQNGKVILRIFTQSGQIIRTLVNREMNAGQYKVRWNGRNKLGEPVKAGVYLYQIMAQRENGEIAFTETRRMTLVK